MVVGAVLFPLILMGGILLLERLERWMDVKVAKITPLPTLPPDTAGALDPNQYGTRHLRLVRRASEVGADEEAA
jgi:hypothetical protein